MIRVLNDILNKNYSKDSNSLSVRYVIPTIRFEDKLIVPNGIPPRIVNPTNITYNFSNQLYEYRSLKQVLSCYRPYYNNCVSYKHKDGSVYIISPSTIEYNNEIVVYFYKKISDNNDIYQVHTIGMMVSPKVFSNKDYIPKEVVKIIKIFNDLPFQTEVIIKDIDFITIRDSFTVDEVVNIDNIIQDVSHRIENEELDILCY